MNQHASGRSGNIKNFQPYYEDVIRTLTGSRLQPPASLRPAEGTGLIVVTHVMPNTPSFLAALEKVAPIRAVIPKGSSVHYPDIVAQIKRRYPLREDITKEMLDSSPSIAMDLIDKSIPPGESFLIADHGKYFASAIPALERRYGDRLIAVTETTLNGDIQHRKGMRKHTVQATSIARTEFKAVSDNDIGKNVIDALQSLLVQQNGTNLSQHKIGIVGFGTIGSAVAAALRAKGIEPLVYDIHHGRKTAAVAQHYMLSQDQSDGITAKEHLLQSCDVLVFATGNRGLKKNDFSHIRSGATLAMCTSMDDEIDLPAFREEYTLTNHTPFAHTYRNRHTGQTINLLLNGKAVNFYVPEVNNTIALVEAGRIAAILEHLEKRGQTRPSAGQNCLRDNVEPDSEFVINHLWRKHFSPTPATYVS